MSKKKKGSKKVKTNVEELARMVVEAVKAAEAERRRQEQEKEKIRVREEAEKKAEREAQLLETQKLSKQRKQDEDFVQERSNFISLINKNVAAQEDWEQWLGSLPMPNVQRLESLNTFFTHAAGAKETELIEFFPIETIVPVQHSEDAIPSDLYYDTTVEPPSVDEAIGARISEEANEVLQEILDKAYMNEQVITLLKTIQGKALEDRDERKLEWCKTYVDKLRTITNTKLDQFTLSYIHYADDLQRSEKDAQKMIVHNSAACPRDITVDAGPPFDSVPGLDFVKKEKEVEVLDRRDMFLLDDNKEEVEVEEFKGNTKVVKFPPPLPNDDVPEMYVGIWVHNSGETKIKAVNFSNMSFKITKIPYSLQQTRTCIRVIHTSYDHITTKSVDESLLKKKRKYKGKRFVSVGGIINIEQLNMPPPPKTAKGWVMRENTTALTVQPYPTKVEGSSSNSEATLPLEIAYQIPKFVLLKGDSPVFGWWNDKTHLWEEEGVEGCGYDPGTRTATLKLSTLRPFAVIQPRALDFPYREWSITPVDVETARISVTGSRFEVVLELVRGKCRLLQPTDPTLEPIHNKLMDPGVLLLRLARAGINLIPSDSDAKFCRKPKKTVLEPMLHEEISMVATLFEVTGSSWNSSRGSDKSMFKIKLASCPAFPTEEATEDSVYVPDMVQEEKAATADEEEEEQTGYDSDSDCGEVFTDTVYPEWLQVLCQKEESKEETSSGSKFYITQSSDKQFKPEIFEGQSTHTTLRRTLSAYYNQQGVLERTKVDVTKSLEKADQKQDVLSLQQTIQKTLNLLRVFTFH